ncbi:DegT/DnrJ/EryC1/StrS family aminotransferase [Frankia sp. CNm7]|uniref:DegT/DnrJ/EryC1/StrS family aminotransferase n=2 Tax=Frankia nepalensis TaxID=1836974 RepID=A0A937RSY9_9ACTN|nr:DegT/DnrJ/EryC1/StrS family aminotransferase [Frankia nepalensis]MBL7499282.1 DegT/DnrJ/EryC1/StrS family aminotransferase [Frankia nepalensis]MBL7512370.1 DegT/DnrJ/EryC1/StrS family aminotransferase [Frankia nepalensis]MBL7522567.1 DegT/DnrJ/EryC1/StrS family aminotransferase [Frankia nepalensis]MBL7632198.1 DegT/DnrJ/EryC1/StrS family aminotransferase [Frankia nepalensis]
MALLERVVARMPDPVGREQAALLEAELAAMHGVAHAIAVSSGTAALHTALVACDIGEGDEVLLPALAVIMTVAAVVQAGARPVFVDAGPDGEPLDLADAASKITHRTRALLPIHLGGRSGDLGAVAELAASAGLDLIEDACQAHGSRYRGRLLGTIGRAGCFSLKDGKLISSGEGGYLLTDDPDLAARAAAFQTHWQISAAGQPALSRLGTNYRLAEPLAALARVSLAGFDKRLARRRHAANRLVDLVGDVPGLAPIPVAAGEQPNGYSALWRILLPRPRRLCRHLAEVGVINSVGTFDLRAAHLHPACRPLHPALCPHAAHAVDSLLAVPVPDDDARLAQIATLIKSEVSAW